MDLITDGGHPPEDEQFPRWMGESIGFWDGNALVDSHESNSRRGTPRIAVRVERPDDGGRTL